MPKPIIPNICSVVNPEDAAASQREMVEELGIG
jgi:hypothetical protein